MGASDFFEEAKEQSIIKAKIVAKYFWAWAKIIIPRARTRAGRVAYIDLFAGPGRYKDGKKSTPLLIVEQAIQDPSMREMLVTVFNDADPQNAESLQEALRSIPGIETLRYQPKITTEVVGEEMVKLFEKMRLVPTFFFVDPWGYKGLSLRLVNSVLKDWGCDCVFFFNYNRINMGLPNEAVEDHLNALFGKARADALRQQLRNMKPADRELAIVEEIAQALKEMGGEYVLPFRFKRPSGARTSHHLIFVSKNPLGYKIMKEIMAKESSSSEQGVPSFEYSPASERQPLLFELSRPLDDLADMLLNDFEGQELTMGEIYEKHNVGRPYIEQNYKSVLRRLEAEERVSVDPPAAKRPTRKGEVTFATNVKVRFAKKERK